MKRIYGIILYIACCALYSHLSASQKAVICVPIADLIGQQITTLIPNIPAEKAYATIANCAGEIKSSIACPRLHQLLYNDIVEVVKIVDEEACIRILQAYYITPSSSQPQNCYWTLKKNIALLDDLANNNITTSHLPDPINFADTDHGALNHTDVITLIEPFHDSILNLTFSVGTRFIKKSSVQKRRASKIDAFALDYPRMKEEIIKIPRHKCVIYNDNKTQEERIADYVNLLQKWAHPKNGSIAYVWGGTSFTKTTNGTFKEITKTGHTGDYSFYEYEKDTQYPKNGFDCSGVILRAAQICGIPYFCKNTTTIAQCLAPITQEQPLQSGDLILIKGHVMVVSDINKNLLIEARAYGHGYGKLHEIPINQVFDGMETYKDLCDAYFGKKVIKRKDKHGTIRDTFSNVQLFSMRGIKKTNLY
jgi:hypothetical protein